MGIRAWKLVTKPLKIEIIALSGRCGFFLGLRSIMICCENHVHKHSSEFTSLMMRLDVVPIIIYIEYRTISTKLSLLAPILILPMYVNSSVALAGSG